jgi:hypothetical protein
VSVTLQRRKWTAEAVAYWYFRLNGFLSIENFYVHPRSSGGALTDADLLAVRFPHRAERFVDAPSDVMVDDEQTLALTSHQIDLVIAEIKEGRCALNGPWTDPERGNMQRVVAAIGLVTRERIEEAAAALYNHGYFEAGAGLRARLVAFGSATDESLKTRYPCVTQVTIEGALRFMYRRFQRYRRQKTDTQHWNDVGRRLKTEATKPRRTEDDFVAWALGELGASHSGGSQGPLMSAPP